MLLTQGVLKWIYWKKSVQWFLQLVFFLNIFGNMCFSSELCRACSSWLFYLMLSLMYWWVMWWKISEKSTTTDVFNWVVKDNDLILNRRFFVSSSEIVIFSWPLIPRYCVELLSMPIYGCTTENILNRIWLITF